MFSISNFLTWWNYSSAIQVFIITGIPIGLWMLFLVRCQERRIKIVSTVATMIMVLLIVYITVLDRSRQTVSEIDLVPFSFILRGIRIRTVFREYWMNVYLFIPFGLESSAIMKKRHWRIVLIGFAFSIVIESIQYIYSLGFCETDDVIANTLGCLIGVYLHKVSMRFKSMDKQKTD